jgi:hypothetical protein
MKRFLLSLATTLVLAWTHLAAQCNGDSSLCNRRYDQVCHVTTHNAFNYQGSFLFPNQSHSISQQLQAGVRGLMLDVYWSNNQAVMYHSSNWLGSQPLVDRLNDIKAFLDQNPQEIVTIIFECYITVQQMEAAFQQANLMGYLHVQPLGQTWPTLADMIQNGKRLVVFTDANDTQGYDWYHHVWDYAVETHYTAYSRADFSCNFNRGDSANSLFILNHFVTQNPLGYGILDSAAAINSNPYLLSRAMNCWTETGKLPNFLTVDFYEQGDVFQTRDAIHAGLVGVESPAVLPQKTLGIAPNPNAGQFEVYLDPALPRPLDFEILDLQGKLISKPVWNPGLANAYSIATEGLQPGMYVLRVHHLKGSMHAKFIIGMPK